MKRLAFTVLVVTAMAIVGGVVAQARPGNKWVMSHNGRSICVADNAVAFHLAHGDPWPSPPQLCSN